MTRGTIGSLANPHPLADTLPAMLGTAVVAAGIPVHALLRRRNA